MILFIKYYDIIYKNKENFLDSKLNKQGSIALAKLKQLNDVFLQSQISNVFLAFLSYFILRDDVNHDILFCWLFIFVLICIIRTIVLKKHKKEYNKNNSVLFLRYLNQHRFGIFFASLIWGVGALVIYPAGNLELTFYFVFILMGVIAGALIIHSIDLLSASFYPITILIPLIYNLAINTDSGTLPILIGSVLFFIFIILNIRKVSKDRESFLAFNYDLIISQNEKALSEERYKLLLNYSPIGIVHYDMDLKVSYCNEQFLKIMGIKTTLLEQINLDELKDQNPIKSAKEALNGKMTKYDGLYEMSLQNKLLWIQIISSPVKNKNDMIIGGVSIIQDVTEQKNAENKIKKLAFYDPLTLLPNRRMLLQKLNKNLSLCKENKNHGVIMFLDLDRFKSLNDTLGHDYGDLLLKKVAQRLRECVKKDDMVARIGGDEFIILLSGANSSLEKIKQHARIVSQRVLDVLNEPFELLGYQYHTSPSIGVVVFGEKENTEEDLLRYADIAMYQAKKSGRNLIKFFDYTMQHEITRRVSIENELQTSLKANDFILYYQPQFNHEGKIYGAEALLRWKHPKKGLITPAKFISIAEEMGLLVEIGYQVLEMAFNQMIIWQKSHLKDLQISINISAIQFKQDNFVNEVALLIKKYKINANLIKFEITEGTLIECSDEMIRSLLLLRQMGIKISLDDFGVGYSSLNYLKKLPINELKIDKSFIKDITLIENDYDIVKTIIAVADSFKFNVIAEGVENKEQCELLAKLGCNNFQGYYFSKPISPNSLEEFIWLKSK